MSFIFDFDHRHDAAPRDLKALLGGKGANLAEMTSVLGLPVPPGFTVTTDACLEYLANGWPDGLTAQLDDHLVSLQRHTGKELGASIDPLLVSVRSGASVSMPGMMDTVLNLGLNDLSVRALAERTGDERFAFDSYRRFIQMYATVVLGLDAALFEQCFERVRSNSDVTDETDASAGTLAGVVEEFLRIVAAESDAPFPQSPSEQLRGAIEAVFESWNSPRAVAYRRHEQIPRHLGTAVNIQAMVFGNMGDDSGTGVGFSRNPVTGVREPYGDFLVNAQGEDVVAGTRNTLPLALMAEKFPGAYDELLATFSTLERHYRDMVDTEFTVERNKLWMLQTRTGKRTGAAALRIAVELSDDPAISLSHAEAIRRVEPQHLEQVLHPRIDAAGLRLLTVGLAASPGAGVGAAYFDADRCAAAAARGEDVILVRQETAANDVHGMLAAKAVLTSRGGLVSHAAVVARGWGTPAVCGAEELKIASDSMVTSDGTLISEGAPISIDGTTGRVYAGMATVIDSDLPVEFDVLLGWADEIRGGELGVRANADNATDAARARVFGADGIGLCRTEHMFLGEHLPVVRRVILAADPESEASALAELAEVQRQDFGGVLEAMDGLPVTVRLLDPPLHEFLPSVEELRSAKLSGSSDAETDALLGAAEAWSEHNPMLGVRGVRLGIIKPDLYRTQVRSLLAAVSERRSLGGDPRVEIMIPLVVNSAEFALVRSWIGEEIHEALGPDDDAIVVGTMVETPRAALCSADIAVGAGFFSFGTNDLTQMTFGFSRDDVGPILEHYIANGLLDADPFKTLDRDGVGALIERSIADGRSVNSELKVGVCGEHGGDAASIRFFFEAGVDYVSCSPFRVPSARLAAAQAVLSSRPESRDAA